jgi:hypothetical protein
MAVEIVGRGAELRSLAEFFETAPARPAALVLEGEAGIGKSTLWLAGVDAAREGGFRVLASRPAEAERGLAFAGLGDLFEDVLEEIVPLLPPPRRRALEAALLLEDTTTDGVDPRALGVAVRSGLEILSSDARLLIAVDDVQWLDRSSASAVSFALRRRLDDPIVLLLARRLGEEIEPSETEQALGPDSVERLAVGPLSVGAIQRLLHDRLGRRFRASRCCASTRPRAATRSTRSSSRVHLGPMWTPPCRSRCPSRWSDSSVNGSPRCRARPGDLWRSPPLSVILRMSFSGLPESRRTPSARLSQPALSNASTATSGSRTPSWPRPSTRSCRLVGGGASIELWRDPSATRSSAPAILRFRQTLPTLTSPLRSTRRRRSPWGGVRWPLRSSSGSTR